MAIVAKIREKEREKEIKSGRMQIYESQARIFYRFCSRQSGRSDHQSGTSLINRTAGSTRPAPLLQLLPFLFPHGSRSCVRCMRVLTWQLTGLGVWLLG